MTTTMDEKISTIKDTVKDLYKSILAALDSNTWGYDDYSDKFIQKLEEAAIKVSELNRLLK